MPPRRAPARGQRGGRRGRAPPPEDQSSELPYDESEPSATTASAPGSAVALTAPSGSVAVPPNVPVEDFGRDRDLRNLLKSLQPKPFSGEGGDVPKVLEEWFVSMEDYFQFAGYNDAAKSILGRAKLDGAAKTWWKINCQNRGVSEYAQSWDEIKEQLKERYLPLDYSTSKMNEFLACSRKDRSVEVYYEEFIKLSRHAPHLTADQSLSRFVQGLEGSLADEVEALRPVSLADALIRAKSKLKSLQNRSVAGEKRKVPPFHPVPTYQPQRNFPPRVQPQVASVVSQPYRKARHPRVNSVASIQEPLGPQCFNCGKRGHIRRECTEPHRGNPPILTLPPQAAPRPLPPQVQVFQAHQNQNAHRGGRNGRGGRGNQSGRGGAQGTVNVVTLSDEMEERAEIYAALDPSGRNQQYSVIETPVECQGGSACGARCNFAVKGEEVAE